MIKISPIWRAILTVGLAALSISCQESGPDEAADREPLQVIPTIANPVATLVAESQVDFGSPLPPTWTPDPFENQTATPVGAFSPTEIPTYTPFPTLTQTPVPTSTPQPTATPQPVSQTAPPVNAVTPGAPLEDAPNLLVNPSFEGGWYHMNGDPELQIPDTWRFEFDEGDNPLDPDPWNKWVRPEVRVLPKEFLPESEHETFIWEGDQTLKIFKGQGAISIRLLTTQNLTPGAYRFTVHAYPDLIVDYSDSGGKVFADEREAGEVQFLIDGTQSGWFYPSFGTKNRLSYAFVVEEEQQVTLGIAIRGRWAILNNGWFLDDWMLQQVN
ncbi:MAG: hypothetical protein AAF633_02760 [Chloroflexota bacterium]